MSDIPDSYFLNGKELLEFRREPVVIYPGDPVKKKKKRKGGNKKSFLIMRDGMLCHYCKEPMLKHGPHHVSAEHIVPRSLGGSNEAYNLVLAGANCNGERGSEYYKCSCDFCKEARNRHENSI